MSKAPYTLHLGDCLETLRALPDSSVDSIVTDPPYGLSKEPDMAEVLRHWLAGDDYQHNSNGFMGKSWDSFVPGPAVWKECLRVLKPGGHLLAFFGTRTQDMGTLAIRLAGFEIRDSISWIYASGFPKSLDVSKAIDKAAGAEREVIGKRTDGRYAYEFNGTANANRPTGAAAGTDDAERIGGFVSEKGIITAPSTDAARQWQGWGTALKPALEPITVARKPLVGTVAANVLAHGTGALNIDGCRVPTSDKLGGGMVSMGRPKVSEGWDRPWMHDAEVTERKKAEAAEKVAAAEALGRWPANLIHDGSDEVVVLFPANAGASAPVKGTEASEVTNGIYGKFAERVPGSFFGDKGSAARFFYCAKASRKDRNEGVGAGDRPAVTTKATMREREDADWPARNGNHHPTVKPTDLMAYLCRLVTPPGGTVLDPFMGSGSTGKAAMREGFRFIGCELSPEYLAIARARIEHELPAQPAASTTTPEQHELFSLDAAE